MTYPNDNFNDRNFTTGNTDLPTGEYRYDKDSIHQDAASGQAQQTAASGYHPSDANKKSTGRGKKGTALLLAGCLVLSMVGGAGGAVIAAKSGLLGTGSTVLYQGVEVPSTNGSTIGVSYSGVVQQVEDSVVAITTESVATNYFFRQYVTQGAGSGVVLTADGRAVLPKIEKLCAAHHSLMQTVEGLKDMDSGLVKIATFSSVSAQWLPRILKSFGKVYPNIEFEVVTGDFYDQIEGWIVNGTVDCGFLRLPSVKRLQTYALHRDELQVIVPCDHPYADRDPFPVSALAEEPFIQLEEGDDYEIMAAFDEMGIRPNVKYIAREDRTILATVSEGLGISLLPELMVRHSPTPIKVCHAPLHFYRTIGIGVKDKKALSNSTRLFVDYVRTWVAENGNA